MKARLADIVLGCVLAAAPAAALAHHSFAMFDNQKTVTLDGTVVEFQWTNPHVWIELKVRQPNNNDPAEWSVEGSSAALLRRRGGSRLGRGLCRRGLVACGFCRRLLCRVSLSL